MIAWGKSFIRGVGFAVAGVRIFYRDRSLWKYAVFAMGAVVLFYGALIAAAVAGGRVLVEYLTHHIRTGGPGGLQWLADLVGGMAVFVVICLAALFIVYTVSSLYEVFGGIFFDALMENFEKKYYGFVAPRRSPGFCLRFVLGSMLFSINTLWLMLLMWVLSLILPVIGHIIMVAVVGSRFAAAYCAVAGYDHGLYLSETVAIMRQAPAESLGFGVISYLLSLVPGGIVFTLPGLIIGGAELLHAIPARGRDASPDRP